MYKTRVEVTFSDIALAYYTTEVIMAGELFLYSIIKQVASNKSSLLLLIQK